jgi:hypothetical protein
VQFINIRQMQNVLYFYIMDHSIFMDKSGEPTNKDLKSTLGEDYALWNEIRDRVIQLVPDGVEEWNFPGKKYGWSFRIKDKRRAIVYLLPREGEFMVAFVFGQKAYDAIMQSDIAEQIKSDLTSARVYAEGRGIRISVADRSKLGDIFKLIDHKLAF